MRLRNRVGIVAFTIGSCVLAAVVQKPEHEALRDPQPLELYDTVQAQLLALRAQRYQEAYLQVSSRYMNRNDLERFVESSRGNLSGVRQAVRWEFGPIENLGIETEVPVRFFLPNAGTFQATYSIIREDRRWKIDRVRGEAVRSGANPAGVRI